MGQSVGGYIIMRCARGALTGRDIVFSMMWRGWGIIYGTTREMIWSISWSAMFEIQEEGGVWPREDRGHMTGNILTLRCPIMWYMITFWFRWPIKWGGTPLSILRRMWWEVRRVNEIVSFEEVLIVECDQFWMFTAGRWCVSRVSDMLVLHVLFCRRVPGLS